MSFNEVCSLFRNTNRHFPMINTKNLRKVVPPLTRPGFASVPLPFLLVGGNFLQQQKIM